MSFFNKKREKGSGKFKPKLIGSIVGSIFFAILVAYSGFNILTGNLNIIEGSAYDIKGDFYLLVFGIAFLAGFMYWGIANFIEHKKVKEERKRKKTDGKSNQHKKKKGGKHG